MFNTFLDFEPDEEGFSVSSQSESISSAGCGEVEEELAAARESLDEDEGKRDENECEVGIPIEEAIV
jgi:hypothetical protein